MDEAKKLPSGGKNELQQFVDTLKRARIPHTVILDGEGGKLPGSCSRTVPGPVVVVGVKRGDSGLATLFVFRNSLLYEIGAFDFNA